MLSKIVILLLLNAVTVSAMENADDMENESKMSEGEEEEEEEGEEEFDGDDDMEDKEESEEDAELDGETPQMSGAQADMGSSLVTAEKDMENAEGNVAKPAPKGEKKASEEGDKSVPETEEKEGAAIADEKSSAASFSTLLVASLVFFAA